MDLINRLKLRIQFNKKKLIIYLLVFIGLFILLFAYLIFFGSGKGLEDGQQSGKSRFDLRNLASKSKFSFEVLNIKPSPEPEVSPSVKPEHGSNESPSPSPKTSISPNPSSSSLVQASFSPSPSPSFGVSPSPSLLPSPSVSASPSPHSGEIPIVVIPPIPDDEIVDFEYFLTFSDPSFNISFKYHLLWQIEDNLDTARLYFLDKNKVKLQKSKIFYDFEDPDYMLGKYEIMQVNMFNSQGSSLVEWLIDVNSNANTNFHKLIYQQIGGKNFLRLSEFENQVYYEGPGGKIYSFWFYCADFSGCSGKNNEKLFRKILETVS